MPEKNNINERSNQRTIKMYAQNLKRETKNQEENETRNRFEAVTLSDAPILFFLILIFFLSFHNFIPVVHCESLGEDDVMEKKQHKRYLHT